MYIGDGKQPFYRSPNEQLSYPGAFAAVLNQPLVGIAFLTPDGTILTANGAIGDMLGVPPEQLEGRSFIDFAHPDDQRRIRDALRSLSRETFATTAMEQRCVRPNGEVIWTNSGLSIVPREKDQSPRVLLFLVNVTASHQAQEQLRRFNATLEQRVRDRTLEAERRAGQLRAMAAELSATEYRERRRLAQMLHDQLQQTLVAAKMRLGGVVRRMSETPSQAPLKEVEQLLTQALHESRALTTELSPPVLNDAGLGPALAWLARRMADKHNLQVEVNMGASDCGTTLEQRVLLFQIVRELLFNVVKHAGVDRASVTLECDGPTNRIVVEDEGKGFDPTVIDHATERQGFGLLSAREQLAAIGADLLLSSTPGKGTRIVISVPNRPIPVVDDAMVETETAHAPETNKNGNSGKLRVLLVDDHKIMRDGLVSLLREASDIEVVGEACDGVEAVQLARDLRPNVVIMDISMPRMNGIEATRLITREHPEMRVIGLSMHEKDDMAAAMMNAGATALHTKGCPADDLLTAVRAVADG